jgi:membrane fusion protein (multidrug efflux system)
MWVWMAVLLACGKPGESGKERDTPAVVTVVSVSDATEGDVVDVLTTTSVVEAEREADVVPITAGRVLSIHAGEGDAVERGDLLAVLESVSLSAGADRARAEVARLSRQVEDMRRLRERGAVSERELEDLEYQLQTARTNAREASRSYGQMRLTAPFDGVVARRDVKVGELASGAAFRVVDMSAMRVVVDLPERDVARVQVGQPVLLESAYDPDLVGKGIVTRVSPVIDATTGTFRATIELQEGALRPGQFVNAHIEVDRHRDVLTVPRDALVWEDGKPVVFVMVPAPEDETDDGASDGGDPGFVAARTSIQIGLLDENAAEVLDGVESGAEVVVVGQSNLKDGARIRAVEDSGGADPSGLSERTPVDDAATPGKDAG